MIIFYKTIFQQREIEDKLTWFFIKVNFENEKQQHQQNLGEGITLKILFSKQQKFSCSYSSWSQQKSRSGPSEISQHTESRTPRANIYCNPTPVPPSSEYVSRSSQNPLRHRMKFAFLSLFAEKWIFIWRKYCLNEICFKIEA